MTSKPAHLLHPDNDDAAFQRVIEPFVAAVVDLLELTQRLRYEAHHTPREDSPGMAELALEPQFAGSWGSTPVHDAHSFSWLYLAAAEDVIKSIVALVRHPDAHVFGPATLGRVALEACGRAAWLSDPRVTVRARVARAETDRLFSLHEEKRLNPDQSPAVLARYQERRTRILEEAERQGFEKKSARDRSTVSLDEYRPGPTEIVKLLFEMDADFGRLLYGYWSAVSHVTLFGLQASLGAPETTDPTHGPLVSVGLGTSSEVVRTTLQSVLLGYLVVAKFHRELFGWTSPQWERSVLNTLGLLRPLQR